MVDKRFFIDLEDLLREYADDGERFRNTYVLGESHPPEAFVILALRCMNFRGEGNLNASISKGNSDRAVLEDEVRIDFFPRATQVYFGKHKNDDINQRMKTYMLSLKAEDHIGKLDYTDNWISLGFCKHCTKKAKKIHPDYDVSRICDKCLKERNRFLVVVQ